MDDYRESKNETESRLIPCLNLRTKSCYTGPTEDVHEYVGDSPTAIFWCLRTMKSVGPDDDICGPDLCGPDRSCCEPTTRPELG